MGGVYAGFSKEVFSWLIVCGGSIRTFEFLDLKTEKKISQQVKSYCSHMLHLLHEMRDTIFFIKRWKNKT